MIHLKSLNNMPHCLQRMFLQLQKYDMTIKYRPGYQVQLANALSRCSSRSSPQIKLDLWVDYITFNVVWIEKLRETTCEDPMLGAVYKLTQHGWPHLRRKVLYITTYFWDFRDKLSTDSSLLLKGSCLVIPPELKESYLHCLHEGHLSAKKVQEDACQHLYWPGINVDILDYTRRCQVYI